MSYNFFIVGGDKRIFYLAESLKQDGNNVKVLGLEKCLNEQNNNELKIVNSIEEIGEDDIVISSVPLSLDEENVYSPFSDKEIKLKELAKKIKENKNKFFAGKIPKTFYTEITGHNENNLNDRNLKKEVENNEKSKKIVDLLECEELTIMNTIATAEGAIAKAIEETDIILDRSNILILGFGRVGKSLAHKLKAFNANVFVEARKEKDLAWIKALGYNDIPIELLNENLCQMRIIFNTIPYQILNKDRLIYLKNDSVIIDLASKPYGVDFEACKKLNINAILYSRNPRENCI